MRRISLFLCILLWAVSSCIFSMDVLVNVEDPEAALRLLELHVSVREPSGLIGTRRLHVSQEVKREEPHERQPLIKKEWTEDGGSNSKACKICESKYNKNAKVKLNLLCDSEKKVLHAFCKECLTSWAAKKEICPTCSRPFVLSEILKDAAKDQVQTSLSSSIKMIILRWCCCTYFIDNE